MLLNCSVGKVLRVPWTARRLDQSTLKEINPEYSLEGLIAKAEAPKLWLPDKSRLTGKDPAAGKDRGQEKRAAEDEIIRYHHQLNGHEFEHTSQDRGQRSLACCSPWGHKELDMT